MQKLPGFELFRVFVLFLALLWVPQAKATTYGDPWPLEPERYFADADYVFLGKVERIDYRAPKGSRDFHTYVTYRVEQVFKGGLAEKTVTIRFMGGVDDEGTIGLVVDHPLFDKGERDILFVAGNGKTGLPLSGGRQGRLRVSGGKLYDFNGSELWERPDGKYMLGKSQVLPEANFHQAGPNLLQTGKDDEEHNSKVKLPSDAKPVTLESFSVRLRAIPLPRTSAIKDGVISVDPEAPFSFSYQDGYKNF